MKKSCPKCHSEKIMDIDAEHPDLKSIKYMEDSDTRYLCQECGWTGKIKE